MYRIRTLQPHESQLLRELLLRMYADLPTAYGETLANAEQYTDETWLHFTAEYGSGQGKVAFVAEGAGDACGMVMGTVLPKQAVAELEGPRPDSELDGLSDTTILSRMWVAPQVRGQGIGQALIQVVLAWAKQQQQRRVVLGVTEGNKAAERCYQRAGFARNGHVFPHPWHPDLKVHGMEVTL